MEDEGKAAASRRTPTGLSVASARKDASKHFTHWMKTMKNKSINAAQVWKQMEDLLAPQLNFSLADRVIYSHLFRHSRLEGKLQLQFSISSVNPRICCGFAPAPDPGGRVHARA